MSRLTIADVARYPRPGMSAPLGLGFTPDSAAVTWLYAGDGSLTLSLWQIAVETGERTLLAGPGDERPLSREEELLRERTRTRELGVTSYQWASRTEELGLPPVLLIPGPRMRVRSGEGELREIAGTEGAVDPRLSPDGKMISFVREGNLHVIGSEGEDLRALTDGAEDGLTFGLADYIAQEEFDQLHGHWWSRDGSRIAYLRADSRHIPLYSIVHQGGETVDAETHRYPFAGEENPSVELHIADLASGEARRLELPDEDGYLVRVAWWPDPARDSGRLVVQWLNRAQDELQLIAFDENWSPKVLINERQEPWINVGHDARGLDDGRFIWSSEESGYRHLYLHAADGERIRTLTSGDWLVSGIVGLDEPRGQLYFSATRESPLERHLYRVSLDGGEIERLSGEGGLNGAVLSRNGEWLATPRQSLSEPPTISLQPAQGGEPRILFEQPEVTPEALDLKAPELISLPAADGSELYGALYRPDNSDVAPPLVVAVYGGPHAQTVLDAWALTVDLRAQYLAQQGHAVLKLDNRGMAGRGLAFEAHLHRNMGTVEVEDQSAAVEYLAAQGWIDPDRVGIYGWSYGGYMTVMAMLREPQRYKVGVAGAPVSDWDGYDTGYTERYMGKPQDNAEGYKEASLLTHAASLQGKLLLVHGGIDENVHFRHTARLITALTQQDKDYDLLLFPQERHMPRDRQGLEYQERKLAEYFKQYL